MNARSIVFCWLLLAAGFAQAAELSGTYVNKKSPEQRIEFLADGKCFLRLPALSAGTYASRGNAVVCAIGDKEAIRFQQKGNVLSDKDGNEWIPRAQIDRVPWKDVSPVTIVVLDRQTRKPISKFSYTYTIGTEMDEYSPLLVRPTEIQSADGTFSLPAPESCEIDLTIENEELIRGNASKTYRLAAEDGKRRIEVVVSLGVTVRGEVVDAATGKPIQGATASSGVFCPPMGFGPDEDRAAQTDAQGKFIIQGVDIDQDIYVSHPDYFQDNLKIGGGVVKKVGERLYSARIALRPGEKITGVVKNGAGKPIGRVVVSDGTGKSVQTDANGLFRRVSAADTLYFVKDGYLDKKVRLDEDNRTKLSVVLEPQPVLCGQVLRPDGRPVADYVVSAGAGSEPSTKKCSTGMIHDAEGRFSLPLKTELDSDGEPAKPEHVWIGVNAFGFAPWETTVDGWEGTKSLAVRLKRGVVVSGLVKVAQDRAKNVSVVLLPCPIHDQYDEDPSQREAMGGTQATLDSGGAFLFDHVGPGPHRLVISGPAISPVGVKISVADLNLDVGRFAPQGTGSIYGVIYQPPAPDYGDAPVGKRRRVGAFAEGRISISNSAGRFWNGKFDYLSIPFKADSKGRFQVEGVPIGTVNVDIPYLAAIDFVNVLSRKAKVLEGKPTEVRFFDTSGDWDVTCKFFIGDGSPAQFALGTGMGAKRKVAEVTATPPKFFVELEPKDDVATSFSASSFVDKLDNNHQALLRDVHPGKYRVVVMDSLRDRGFRDVLYEATADFKAGNRTLTIPLAAGCVTGAVEWPAKDVWHRRVHVTAVGKKTHTIRQAGCYEDGCFCVRYLPADEYTFWCHGGSDGWCRMPQVSVNSDITDIGSHKLVPGGTIVGRLPPRTDTDVTVSIVARDQNGVSIDAGGDDEPTGAFSVSGLWPGKWTLTLKAGNKVITEDVVTLKGTETVTCRLIVK